MRNGFRVEGEYAFIKLKSDKYGEMETKISLCDLDKARSMPYTWYPKFNKKNDAFYVAANVYVTEKERSTVRLHRFLLSPKNEYLQVDHINHDTLDNSRDNLRLTTPSQNQQNRIRSNTNNKAGALGVSFRADSGKYRVRLYKNRKLIFNEEFDSLEIAESVSLAKRSELFGGFFTQGGI